MNSVPLCVGSIALVGTKRSLEKAWMQRMAYFLC